MSTYGVPIDGVEGAHMVVYSQAQILWLQGGVTAFSGSDFVNITDRFSAALPHGTDDGVTLANGTKSGVGPVPTGTGGTWVTGVRFPYGRALFT